LRNVGVLYWKKVWLKNSLSQNFFQYNTPTFFKPSSFYTHLLAYEDGIDSVFQNVGITSDDRELPRRKHTTFSFTALPWPGTEECDCWVISCPPANIRHLFSPG